MEIGPIFRALFSHKTRFFLVVGEIALTMAIVVNCLNMIADQRSYLTRSSGMDEENILVVESEPFAPEFEDDMYAWNSYDEDLALLQSLPGVRAAAGFQQIPLSGGGSSTGRRALDSKDEPIMVPYFSVSPQAVETLGIEIVAGRNFVDADWAVAEELQRRYIEARRRGETPGAQEGITQNVLVTRSIADKLFPDQDPLGKVLTGRDGVNRNVIVGVIREMHCSWPLSEIYDRVMLFPDLPFSGRLARYLVRAEPGNVDALYTGLEDEMLKANAGRIVTVRTLKEIKHENLGEVFAMVKMLSGISILLVVVTSLGIIGLTAFSVTQRRRQIGTRRALGATRWAVLRYFLVENGVVTVFGLGLGLLLTYGLNFTLAQMAGLPMIGFPLVAAGMGILWVVGFAATFASAFRSMSISPVLATRTV